MTTVAEVLRSAQAQGLLGPGPLDAVIAHALAFATVVPETPGLAVDLGSGAGVPGLVLAGTWPEARWVLLEGSSRRAAFLRDAVDRLSLAERVRVVEARAEVAGRDDALRGQADLVVVRSFGPPAVVAECAAPLLRTSGLVVVAEPPGGAPQRWRPDGLELLGLATDGAVTEPYAFQRLRLLRPCPARYPRRTGVPAKRPLFGAEVNRGE